MENLILLDESIKNIKEKYEKYMMEYIRIKKIEEKIKNNYYIDVEDNLGLVSHEYKIEYSERIREMYYSDGFKKFKEYLLKDREYEKVYNKYQEYKKMIENMDEKKGLSKKYIKKFKNKFKYQI